MSKASPALPDGFPMLLKEINNRIGQSQTRAVFAVNAELVRLYWDIGRIIDARQQQEGWGAAVIPRLARDLASELPELKGFSERNIKRMLAFFRAYPDIASIVPQPAAQVTATAQVPQADLVQQLLKDPYIFDFLTLQEPFHERELETNLLHQLERFLLELGQGFAFVGRQFHLQVGDRDFYIDLLFYHLKLRCFVVIDLKKGEFKPEYAGKINFYLSVTDDQLRHPADARSIGLTLCQDRNHVVAEYALQGVAQPIGISEYELTRALPADLRSALPTVEEIEAELAELATTNEPAKEPAPPPLGRDITRATKPAEKNTPKKGRRK